MSVQELEEYYEIARRVFDTFPPEERLKGLAPEQRMAGLAPEQRMAGLAPEQRVAGLAPEQVVRALLPAMPDNMLRELSDDFIAKLPEPTRTAVRKRLGR